MSGREKERRKGEGGVRNVMRTPAPRQTKGTGRLAGRPRRPGRARPEGGRSRTPAAGRTRHLPADGGAAAPGSAAAAASTPLCCDREGRLVLTARRDWQASEPLRSLASPRRGRPTNPHCEGVCPSAKNGRMCSVTGSRPSPARVLERRCERARVCAPAGAPCTF